MRKKSKSRSHSSLANLGISHVGLRVKDVQTSLAFYREVLGLNSNQERTKRQVARIPVGPDEIVLHKKVRGKASIHFGFQVSSIPKVEEWKNWLKSRNSQIYDDITEKKYRSFKIKDPDNYMIEIFYDERP